MIYLELFWTFLTIGAFTFGGGYAMLPLIQEQVGMRWSHIISDEAMVNFIAVSESTPGPFAVNMATYVGSQVGGVFGSFCATLGVVLPSFIIILVVAQCYDKFRNSRIVKGCMTGLKPAVVGLIGNAVIGVLLTVFFPGGFALSAFTQGQFYVYTAIFAGFTVSFLGGSRIQIAGPTAAFATVGAQCPCIITI